MFTTKALDHDERGTSISTSGVQAVMRLWVNNSVDSAGRHLQLQDGCLEPKPAQTPRPPITNVGFSRDRPVG